MLEEAREVDSKTIAVLVGHIKLSIFDNLTNFKTNVSQIVNAAANLVFFLPMQSDLRFF